MSKYILVTGGAGYIGGVLCRLLIHEGYIPVVIDSKFTDYKYNEHKYYNISLESKFYQINVGSLDVCEFMSQYDINDCIHLAAYCDLRESIKNPNSYYENNVIQHYNFINILNDLRIKHLIFASSCAVYDQCDEFPLSPYGNTKLIGEKIIEDCFHGNYVNLRLFNVAGAIENVGERKDVRLIPNLVKSILYDKEFVLNGDGKNERDFVHVIDVAEAFLKSLRGLWQKKHGITNGCFDIGSGKTYSVNQIINYVERSMGKKINIKRKERIYEESLYIQNNIINSWFEWKAKGDIFSIIKSEIKWQTKLKKEKELCVK